MASKRKTRMYEPWGYVDENNYLSSEIIMENDLYEFFADTKYVKDDNKIYFYNKDGDKVGELDVSEFVKSDSIIEKTEYSDGILTITFTNGDVITIDLTELLDENEFKDGLTVSDHVVKVLVDPTSESWLTVSEDGVKVSGIQAEIDRLDEKIDNEVSRATSEEQRIEGRLNDEITRATNEENRIDSKLDTEITRATSAEQNINFRVDTLNDELDAEESIREANDVALGLRITTETNDRIAAVTAEKDRAEAAEQALDERIDEIISGSSIEGLNKLIEKLGYKDNDTLERTNEHEVAFGEYNISHTSEDASGQTIFSIGNGTSENEKSNAVEVMKNGDLYLWVEGEFMNVNKLLGQLAHEVYDTGTNP